MDENGCSRKSNWIKGIASGLMIAGGIALCFVPGAQVFGAALIITGAGGLIGGGISAATGGDFGDGWNIGTAIGAAVGLAIIAPEVIPYVSKLTIPILGLAETSAGISIVVTGTVALTIPTGLIAWGASVFAAGYMFSKNARDLQPKDKRKNYVQNKEYELYAKKFGLNQKQWERIHRFISKKGYTKEEIIEIIKDFLRI